MKKLFVAAALATALTSCSLTLPAAATSNPVGRKVGTATATDASIQKAAQNGGITKISTVDIKQTSILGIVVSYETIVTGE